jgi:uncharacterized protein YdeI (YjbR/CyaY-like superfamily)
VDEALCFGWIDGIRKSIDETRYTNRFTPRRKGSTWSAVNVRRVGELTKLGQMHAAGLEAFERRNEDRTGIYSYEQRHAIRLDPRYQRELRGAKKAWTFFKDQPPSYRTAVTYWIMSAKREETRRRRLDTLIEHSAWGQRVPPLTSPSKPK